MVPVGPLGTADLADLAGNASGELWGFFAWDEPKFVARIDPQNAALLEILPLPQMQGRGAFAAAQWGEDLYLFWYQHGLGAVYRVSESEILDAGSFDFEIVGAGSSTCASE